MIEKNLLPHPLRDGPESPRRPPYHGITQEAIRSARHRGMQNARRQEDIIVENEDVTGESKEFAQPKEIKMGGRNTMNN